jgi:hypothetical protein
MPGLPHRQFQMLENRRHGGLFKNATKWLSLRFLMRRYQMVREDSDIKLRAIFIRDLAGACLVPGSVPPAQSATNPMNQFKPQHRD